MNAAQKKLFLRRRFGLHQTKDTPIPAPGSEVPHLLSIIQEQQEIIDIFLDKNEALNTILEKTLIDIKQVEFENRALKKEIEMHMTLRWNVRRIKEILFSFILKPFS